VVFLGVSVDTDREALDRAVERLEIPWPQLMDGKGYEGEVAMRYAVRAIPDHYLIDAEGKIVARSRGVEGIAEALADVARQRAAR
jgi:hypothetical protein